MNKLIELSKKYVGSKEGSKKHKEIIDGYNKLKPLPRGYKVSYTDSWCATFVSEIGRQAKAKNFPFECSVYYMLKKARENKLDTDVAKVGYLCIYDWKNDGTVNHVGFVESVNDETITVIEGNYSDSVKRRIVSRKNKEIECFIKTSLPVVKPATVNEKEIIKIAKEVINGKYGVGSERKKKLGSLYEIVQKKVNEML